MIQMQLQKGFALFAAVWMVAILGLISLAMTTNYLGNTRATQLDLQRIQATHLLDSGVRFAALSVAATRQQVIATAVPASKLLYRCKVGEVLIGIQNEAGFIDLNRSEPELLAQLLRSNSLSEAETSRLQKRLKEYSASDHSQSYKSLRETLSAVPGLYQRLIKQATLHNGQAGVHPLLASPEVLELLTDLSVTDRQNILDNRFSQQASPFSTPIESDYFSSVVSPYYRITTGTSIDGIRHSRTQIIKMINQPGHLFELVATL